MRRPVLALLARADSVETISKDVVLFMIFGKPPLSQYFLGAYDTPLFLREESAQSIMCFGAAVVNVSVLHRNVVSLPFGMGAAPSPPGVGAAPLLLDVGAASPWAWLYYFLARNSAFIVCIADLHGGAWLHCCLVWGWLHQYRAWERFHFFVGRVSGFTWGVASLFFNAGERLH